MVSFFKSVFCVLVFAVPGMFPSAFAAPPGTLDKLSTSVTSLGAAFDKTVAPNCKPGPDGKPDLDCKQNLYVSYLYFNSTHLDLVAIDPTAIDTVAKTVTTRVFGNPTKTETGARTMILGPDDNLYLGTHPHAHILKFDTKIDPKEQALVDLGEAPPAPSGGVAPKMIWQLAFGADGKLYAATSPNSALIRLNTNDPDPKRRVFENLGTMGVFATGQSLAHSIAPGTGEDVDYMYVGLGVATAQIVAFDTGNDTNHTPLLVTLPADLNNIPGTADVWQGADGNVYGGIASTSPTDELGNSCPSGQYLIIKGLKATKTCSASWKPTNKLSGGGSLTLDDDGLLTIDPATGCGVGPYKIDYVGHEPLIIRLGIGPGPDHDIYGSTAMPARLTKLEGSLLSEKAVIGAGEAYSFATLDSKLYMGIYSGNSPLMEYTPTLPPSSGNPVCFPVPDCPADRKSPVCSAASNPDRKPPVCPAASNHLDATWRPFAMVAGPDGKLYTGGMNGYGPLGGGKLGGPLTVYNPKETDPTKKLKVYDNLIQDQSITTLATWKGMLYGGTSIYGDSTDSTRHNEFDAVLFKFDPASGTVTRKMNTIILDTIQLANGKTEKKIATKIDSLVVTEAGNAFGIAFDATSQAYLFVVDLSKDLNDPNSLLVKRFLGNTVYNSMALGPDGNIWGLANTSQRGGVFKINTKTRTATWVLRPRERITDKDSITDVPVPITGGFVLNGDQMYFSAGPDLWRYTIPYKVVPDVLWRNPSTGKVFIGLMDPVTLTMSSNEVLGDPPVMNSDWDLSAAADFNGDGKNDILWHNTKTGQISIWIMNGNRYDRSVFPGGASTIRKKFIADVNGDGMLDILLKSDTDVSIWLMDGVKFSSSGIDTKSLGVDLSSWDLVGPADFDQDGKPDLLWRHKTTGEVAILLFDGTKVPSKPVFAALDNRLVGTGDFNGDGVPDLVFRNKNSRPVSIWLMTVDPLGLPAFRYSTSLGPANLDWDLAAVTDFDGDGSPDLLWCNNGINDVKSKGKLSVWRMKGTTLASSKDSGTIGSDGKLSAVADFGVR